MFFCQAKTRKYFALVWLVGICTCDNCQSVAEKPVEQSVINGIKSVTKSLKLKHKQNSTNELTKGKSLEPWNKAVKGVVSQWFTFKVTPDELSKLKEGDCPVITLKSNV